MSESDKPDDDNDDKDDKKGSDTSLVGDLESLRGLLDEEELDQSRESPDEVPILDDLISGPTVVDEDPLGERKLPPEAPAPDSTFGDDTIKALLDDNWRQSAEKILATARKTIESVASKWSPQQTNELNQALRVRIDATLEAWLETVIQQRLEELRATLLTAIETEIAEFTANLTQRDPDGE